MNWTDPVAWTGLALIVLAAFAGFLLPHMLIRRKTAQEGEKVTLICKAASLVMALAGVILMILV